MYADFWAGYMSGAAGILIGNPLDLIKVRLQAGEPISASSLRSVSGQFENPGALIRGVTAPILGYGALNAILFVTYNRTLALLGDNPRLPLNGWKIWAAGATGGLATFVISAPTELIKCRAQMSNGSRNSWSITKDLWRRGGLRELYWGGGVTSIRDAVGYGFYFWSYELSKQAISSAHDTQTQSAAKVLLCGGLAGVITWASIFPLDVIKTRVQTQDVYTGGTGQQAAQREALLSSNQGTRDPAPKHRLGAVEIARRTYHNEGLSAFLRGLGVCSVRAFVVNAVQWAVYEWVMRVLLRPDTTQNSRTVI